MCEFFIPHNLHDNFGIRADRTSTFMVKGTREYKRLEGMLKENEQKRDKDLSKVENSIARVEGRLDAALEEIKALINGMALQKNDLRTQFANQEAGVTQGSILGNPRGYQGENSSSVLNEHSFKYATKLDFSRFNKEGVNDWLFKIDQIFMLDKTPKLSKINVISLHLNGCALQWHKNFVKLKGRIPSWEE